MTPKILPVTQFRSQVLKMVRRAQQLGQEYVITSKGKPAAVFINFDEWESLLETLKIKRDKKLMAQIKKGLKYFQSGKRGKPHTEIDWN